MKVPSPKKLKSGTWFIQLRLGGESIYVTASTERECRRQAELIKAEHRSGRRVQRREDMTLRQACAAYIEKKRKAQRSPETIRSYTTIMDHRFQDVMDVPLSRVKDWQKAYDKEASRLAPKTMMSTWSMLKTACKSSCDFTLPDIDPVKYVRTERPFLEPEQLPQFVAAAAKSKYAIPILLCLCSLRSSEVQGLRWEDIDFKHRRIHVQGAMVFDEHDKLVYKDDNKTEESTRYVPFLIPELEAALLAARQDNGKVVTARPNTIYRNINRLCAEIGLPEVGNHGLRHSFASLCYSLEVPIKITMQIGGWSDYNTVLKIYTHLSKRDVEKHTAALSEFFNIATQNATHPEKVQ